MIEAITAYGVSDNIDAQQGTTQVQSSGFADWIKQELVQSNDALKEADSNMKKLASGEPVSLHEVMLSMEEAKLQFQLVTQIRNRILEAYQDVLRMQI